MTLFEEENAPMLSHRQASLPWQGMALAVVAALLVAVVAIAGSAALSSGAVHKVLTPATMSGGNPQPAPDTHPDQQPGANAAGAGAGVSNAVDQEGAAPKGKVPDTWVTGAKPLAPAGSEARSLSTGGGGDYACPAGEECGD
jgi:hypothetical protein